MATIDGYDLDTLNIMMYNNIDPKKPIELDAKMFLFDKPIKSDNGKMWVCTNIRYSEEVLMIKTDQKAMRANKHTSTAISSILNKSDLFFHSSSNSSNK